MVKNMRFSVLTHAFAAAFLALLFAAPARAEGGEGPAEAIRQALVAEGAPDDVEIALSSPLAAGAAPMVIESVSYNRATGRFLARAAYGEGPATAIAGVAASPAYLPVPVRDMPRGAVISEADITFARIVDGMAARFVDDADLVIGRQARRPLAAGEPFRAADLKAPLLMKRGATATIVLDAPGLRLTQTASALENGAAGDLIRFKNVNSGAEIRAVVISPTVASAPARAPSHHAALRTER